MKKSYLEERGYPKSAAVITTYRCTAECKDCCFSCSPRETEKLTLDEIMAFIDEISNIESIQTVIWTGGECSTLGKDLVSAISYAFSKGKCSRIVSNGSWSKGFDRDIRFLQELKSNGLVELNLSTGDNHMRFVPVDKILTIARASVNIGVRVLVSLEKTKYSKFTLSNLRSHPLYQKLKAEDKEGLFSVIEATWISFNQESVYEYDGEAFLEKRKGCDSLYGTIAINPLKEVLSCCGLTIRYMPEMVLGRLGNGPLLDMYNTQLSDFMKQWIYSEGPMKILDYAEKWNPQISFPKFVHPCQACAFIYQTPEVIQTIQENYLTVTERVTEKFFQKLSFNDVFEEKLENK